MRKNDLFRYFKRAIVLSLTIFVAIICMNCNAREDYFISDSWQYYTGQQIEEIFRKNEAQFTEVAKIVQENDAIKENMEKEDMAYARIMTRSDQQYFTDAEWQTITDFFKEVKPMEIEKYDAVKYGYGQGEESIIGILFPQNNEGEAVTLYYIDMPNDIETSFNYAQYYDIFKKIAEHWWLGEELDGIPFNTFSLDNSYYENGEWHYKKDME